MVIYRSNNNGIIRIIKTILFFITLVSVILELVLYPSLPNLVGCIMMVIVHVIFVSLNMNEHYIVEYPFSFVVLIAAFCYRYLPVPGTLLSGRPVSFGMQTPIKTFFLETIFFIIIDFVFIIACQRREGTTFLQRLYDSFGVFSRPTNITIWLVGIIGLAVRIYSYIYLGGSSNGTIDTFIKLMYAPILLFFPCFYKDEYDSPTSFNRVSVWIYFVLITIVNLGSNSRGDIIAPFIMLAVLFIIYLCKENIDASSILNPTRLISFILVVFVSFGTIQVISDAMLEVRGTRTEVSISELIGGTIYYIRNSSIEDLIFGSDEDTEATSYSRGWTEDYIDNFALNRFANIRITDETLYYESGLSESGRESMLKDLGRRIVSLIPQPILNSLGVNITKSDYAYSRSDALQYYSSHGNSSALGHYRVTSHLADGLATFGYFYFLIQGIVLYVLFKLLNSLVSVNEDGNCIYAAVGIFGIYDYLVAMTNANGIFTNISMCLRGFWFDIIIFLIVCKISEIIASIFERRG